MKLRSVVVVTCVLVLSAMVWVRAEDTAAKPADSKPAARSGGGRLTQPWNKISSLSDDQKSKIKDIHTKANDEIKAIHDKEQADILALLDDDQKAEAKKLIDEQMASRKSSGAAKTASADSKSGSDAAKTASSDGEKKESGDAAADKPKEPAK